MDRKNHRRLLLAGLATCLLAALALPPGAFAGLCSRDPEPDVVDVDPINNAIVFSPLEVFEAMVLSVTGPFEYSFVQEVGPDENAVFELDPPNTADGCYTWEVRIDPILDGEILAALASARQSGDYSQVRALMRSGNLPDRARVQSGAFQVVQGRIILGGGPPEEGQGLAANHAWTRQGTKGGPTCGADVPRKDYLIYDDLIVDGSACVGFDCSNGWSFDYTTIAMSEHNTRIKFDDTSYLASYPNNDWQLKANEASNGGAERFSIIDCGDNDAQGYCSGGTVFSVEAGAPGAALYVDDHGRVGFGTPTPYYELHVVDGDTPTLRLAQDGSSGFTPQTWDVAGNEANFFIRDATNGSKLPFRILPGAPTSSIVITSDGDVGLGTSSPDSAFHVSRTGNVLPIFESSNGNAVQIRVRTNSTNRRLVALDGSNNVESQIVLGDNGDFQFLGPTASDVRASLDSSGNMTVEGTLVTGGGGTCDPGPCDGVFLPDYSVESIEEHSAYMWKNHHLPGVGPTPEGAPINLTQKTTGILKELEKAHIYIEQLHTAVKDLMGSNQDLMVSNQEKDQLIADLGKVIADLGERLARLEDQLDD